VAHDRVDGGERFQTLAIGERRKVPSARDVPCVAVLAERLRERAKLLRAVLEGHRHPDERGLHSRGRFQHRRGVADVVERGEMRVVADMLGHADPAVTLRVYSHALPGATDAAGAALSQALGL